MNAKPLLKVKIIYSHIVQWFILKMELFSCEHTYSTKYLALSIDVLH
jgi:hypothetical protein